MRRASSDGSPTYITGLINPRSELDPKRLELLKEAFPRISRVAILWSRRQQKQVVKEVEAAGQSLGIQIQPLVVDPRIGLASLESALSTISKEPPDALLVQSIRTTLPHRARIIDFAAKLFCFLKQNTDLGPAHSFRIKEAIK